MREYDKILGTLYGQAIGDAMGMPSELWPIEKIQKYFSKPIVNFLDGPQENDIAKNYRAGEFTDDTGQALAILDALIGTNWKPNSDVLFKHIMSWADSAGAWEHNILGPSSKAALALVKAGKDPSEITKTAITNGAGMRISPIGTLFEPHQLPQLVQMVYDVSKITHTSDVAISGASMVAGAVTAAMADWNWDEIIEYAIRANNWGLSLGSPTWAAKTSSRLAVGIDLAHKYRNHEKKFAKAIYEVVGTGTMISESVPAAVAIAYYTRDVQKCALMCANLGGDTDTIGAMATAICGAKQGAKSIPDSWRALIDRRNPQYNFKQLADQIIQFESEKK